MTDKELLEMAARAAGYNFAWYCRGANNPNGEPNVPCVHGTEWNPLTDDGDALRLAATLKMDIQSDEDQVTAWIEDTYSGSACVCDHHGRLDSAYRMAIVRAAAEIGRAMP